MRVLLLSPASNIHTQRWANGLVERGIDVHVASWHMPLPGYLPEVVHHDLPWKGGKGYFLNGPAFRKVIKEYKPDLVNAHYASGYGTLSRWVKNTPLLLSVWGSDVYDFPNESPVSRWLLIGNIAAADALASTSHAMSVQTQKWCKGTRPIAVTPFGIDINRFQITARSDKRDEIRIGTIKTLLPKYGIDLLLKAFALLRARVDQAVSERLRLEIVGGGESREELEKLAGSLGISEVTSFVGKIPHADVPSRLARFDIYVALSRLDSESFGVAVLEASACGVPVVVSDVGGLPEVVVHGETGLVVPREDPHAASLALEQLVLDRGKIMMMGNSGREHVVRSYSWEKSLDIMLETYQNLLNSFEGGK
ncbi:MAG: glycosyltransferase [Fibrobacteres bacterium]|nr:glycosyltransferase [Fibrobacterota bacterium]